MDGVLQFAMAFPEVRFLDNPRHLQILGFEIDRIERSFKMAEPKVKHLERRRGAKTAILGVSLPNIARDAILEESATIWDANEALAQSEDEFRGACGGQQCPRLSRGS